ncbi:MAG: heavy metal translocating P-type ATPase [Clostridiales Family XIII bacterium]|jgi:heavy metal translocating P-type ATPase|nr:heavy metal translocating P-type ATPase [Clostridiales Family XIII bacterium]
MRYTIASDGKGRIRLRCGRDAFTEGQRAAAVAAFKALPCVEKAEISRRTGSVLLHYRGDRDALLRFARELDPRGLAGAPEGERDATALLDAEFKRKLLWTVGKHALRKLLLPLPFQRAWCVLRACLFLSRALREIGAGRLGVEALDAAAIGATVLRGQFTTATSIIFLIGLSDLLEEYTRRRTRNALAESLLLHVDTVWIDRDGEAVPVKLSELRTGERVIVRTGSVIPVDGVVRRGEALVNQSTMTGEAAAVRKAEGSAVFAGTAVEEGEITVEASSLGGESRIHRIVELIHNAEHLKADAQSRAEKLADKIVPFNFLLAAGVFLCTRSVDKAVFALLVDYSCAIRLATPISVISAMREASGRSIVVKGGRYLEAVAAADTIVFDKTGTLTLAMPRVSKVLPFEGYSRESVLRLAACLEEHFPHSVARAIVKKAREEGLPHEEEHARVEYVVAHGIASALRGKRVVVGSRHFVCEDEGIAMCPEQDERIAREAGGDSAVYLAVDGRIAGVVFINDTLRQEAPEVIDALRRAGLRRIVMLTGDSELSAREIGRQLGLSRFCAQMLPEEKARVVRACKAEGRKLIMVGDGVNDSPALAEADVSVAMKDASDLAREVADITLLRSDLRDLLYLRRLSVGLMRRIARNYRGIIAFNTALLLLGLSGLITPGASALLHNLSTILISAASTKPIVKV